jgi:small subunit ribosomal protein S6
LFDGILSDEAVAKEQQSIEQLISQNGDFEKVEAWGRRRLAYEINRKKAGIYFLFKYQSDGELPVKLERLFKLNPNILRYLTVLRDLRTENNIRPVGPVIDDTSDMSSDNNDKEKGAE